MCSVGMEGGRTKEARFVGLGGVDCVCGVLLNCPLRPRYREMHAWSCTQICTGFRVLSIEYTVPKVRTRLMPMPNSCIIRKGYIPKAHACIQKPKQNLSGSFHYLCSDATLPDLKCGSKVAIVTRTPASKSNLQITIPAYNVNTRTEQVVLRLQYWFLQQHDAGSELICPGQT